MKKNITLITMLLLLAVSFVSCGSKDEPVVVLPLNVASIVPVNADATVELLPTIKIDFDKDINKSTISGIQLLNSANAAVDCNVSVVGTKTVTLVPKANLEMGTKYTVKVTGVKAVDTGALTKDVTSTFTTKTITLTVVSITPANAATAVEYLPTIKIDFDKDVDKNTISGIQLLNPSNGVVDCNITLVGTKTVTLVPKANLEMGTKYTVKVTGVKAVDTGALPKEVASIFTTKTVPLTIVSITPAHKASEVLSTAKIVIVFSKKMKNDIVYLIALSSAVGSVAWSAEYDGNVTVTLTPIGGLGKNMSHYISFFPGIKSLDGEELPKQSINYFNTGSN